MGGDEFRRLVHRVEKLIRSNALDRALLAAEYLVTRWPEEAVCYCARGRVRLAMGEPDQAIQDADRALAMDAGCGKAHIARGDILCALGRLGDALESYGRAAALEPDCVEAYVGKGNALRAQKRYAEALRCYDRAIALDPENGDAHDAKGVALCLLKRFDEALACCRRAVALSPADARVYGHRAALYAEMGLKEAALEDYLRCIALDPQNLSAHAEMLALDKDRLLVGARDTDLKRAVYEFERASDTRNAWPAQERPADAAPPYDRIARFHADSRSGDIWDASETFRNGFDRFLADQVAPCAESPRVHVLRRGNPFTPATAYDGAAAPCGGYFLQHGRTGAAVDPGPGFIADF
ncbi:MAG TPA: tetratricopeptide repeat protein, partial [Candidatus Limnocylindria bacterium]|nr:tetratricopeptide repeat protein [Candidatus Limnocylindria bacterium]